jgi:hypothetical protein
MVQKPCSVTRTLAYLALPYGDESIRSIIGRTLARTGQSVTNTPFASPRLASWTCRIPRYVTALAGLLDASWEITATDLIEHHTLLPYLGAFMADSERSTLAATMAGTPVPRFLRMTELTGTGCALSGWSFCPTCLREDIAQYGEPHEHLVHTIPGLRACPVHNCRLVELHELSLGSLRQLDPGEILEAVWRHADDKPVAASAVDLSIARTSAWLLTHDGYAVLPLLRELLASAGGADVPANRFDNLKRQTARLRQWAEAHDVLVVSVLRESQVMSCLAQLAGSSSCAAMPSAAFVVAILAYFGVTGEDLFSKAGQGAV